MKKFFGIVFLIVGMALIAMGAAVFADSSSRTKTYDGHLRSEFSETYRDRNEEQQAFGAGYSLLGGVIFIMGIVLTASRSKKQQEKEIELKLLKESIANAMVFEDPCTQIEKLGKLRSQGLLSEEEFQNQKTKLLRMV